MFASFFFMIFLIFLFIIIIGSSIIRSILNLIFGRRNYHKPFAENGNANQSQQNTHQSPQSASTRGGKREKLFDKTDGEYVDYEEIKE